ncbi:MAG: methyltransferase domain-containing protein [archaeon]
MKKLNFGCGTNILEGYDNIDIQKGEGIIKSFDFDKFPYPIKDNTYDEILFENTIEHLYKPEKALLELHRICKSDAKIIIKVVYYNNKGAYTDMTHRSFFSERSFVNFVNEVNVPDKQKMFELVSLKLIPSKFGGIFPKQFRRRLSSILSGVIKLIHLELKVIK